MGRKKTQTIIKEYVDQISLISNIIDGQQDNIARQKASDVLLKAIGKLVEIDHESRKRTRVNVNVTPRDPSSESKL